MKNRKLRHVRAALKIVLVGVICIGGLFAVREIYVDDPGKLLVEYMLTSHYFPTQTLKTLINTELFVILLVEN